jgi:hypothetical protein
VYLSNINASPLDPLDTVFANINTAVGNINTSITNLNNSIVTVNNKYLPRTGTIVPIINASFVGQLYVNTALSDFYLADSVGGGATDWTELAKVSDIPPTPDLDAVLNVGDASDQNINLADNVGAPTRYVRLSPTGLSGSAEVFIEDITNTWYILSGFDSTYSNGTVKVGNPGATAVQLTSTSIIFTDDFSGNDAILQFPNVNNQAINFPDTGGTVVLSVNGNTANSSGEITLYKEYVAIIAQSGTTAPTVTTVLDNTLTNPITFSYNGPGSYAINCIDFTSTNTVIFIQKGSGPFIVNVSAIPVSNSITINTSDQTGTPGNSLLISACIQIRVY